MRILSWNVALTTKLLRLAGGLYSTRKNSSQQIFKVIDYHNPDIICLQEVQSYSYNYLSSLLKTKYIHFCYEPETGLLTASKTPLTQEESIVFPKNNFTTCCNIRTGIMYTFSHTFNKYIINVHLPLRKTENDAVLNQLKDCVNSLNGEILLTGDFNINHPDLFNLLNTLNIEKSPVPKTTFDRLVKYQLDYMFYITKNSRIPLEYNVIHSFESDHYPIIYSFSKNKEH